MITSEVTVKRLVAETLYIDMSMKKVSKTILQYSYNCDICETSVRH